MILERCIFDGPGSAGVVGCDMQTLLMRANIKAGRQKTRAPKAKAFTSASRAPLLPKTTSGSLYRDLSIAAIDGGTAGAPLFQDADPV